jgi:hypothetical protein
MYLFNDIDFLLDLARTCKVHTHVPSGSLAISRMKKPLHGYQAIQQLNGYPQIVKLTIDDLQDFEAWRTGKGRHLTSEDLSTIYLAHKNPKWTLVVTREDIFLPDVCKGSNIHYKPWNEVIDDLIEERWVEFYKSLQTG